ncbi:MAG: hypothetical protein ACSNEK_02605 [Parachlamydiaceae bacterium]
MNVFINSFRNFYNKINFQKTEPTISSEARKEAQPVKRLVTQADLDNHPILRAKVFQEKRPEGRKITENFDKFGQTEAVRIDTLDQNREIQVKKQAYVKQLILEKIPSGGLGQILNNALTRDGPAGLIKKINELETPFAEKSTLIDLSERLVLIEQRIKVLDSNRDHSWIPSPFIRKKWLDSKTNDIPSAPVNLRLQSFNPPSGSKISSFKFARFGAIYDPRDAGNTIEELESYLEPSNAHKLSLEINRRELQSKRLYHQGRIREATAVENSLTPLWAIKDGKINEAKKWILDKKSFVDDQMLQLIMTQIDSRSEYLEDLENQSPFFLAHLGLLNEDKCRMDKTGFTHDEARFMQEMAGAFKRFENRELIFDGKGPWIDEKGNIHLKQSFLDQNGQPKKLILKPIFTNLTVQGSTKNGPIQRSLNQQGLQKIEEAILNQITAVRQTVVQNQVPLATQQKVEQLITLKEKLMTIRNQLNQGQSNYKMACDLFPLFLEFGQIVQNNKMLFASSLCCFSGKDRTGLVAGLSTHRLGVKKTVKVLEKDPQKQRQLLKTFAQRVLYDEESIGHQVVKENTGAKILKVSSLIIPEVSESIVQICRRILHYPSQLSKS